MMYLRPGFTFWLFLLSLVSVSVQAQALYKWVDENGVTHYSDERRDKGAKRVIPSGMSVIPMGGNIRAQKNVENINRSTQTQRQSSNSSSYSSSSYEERQKKREEELLRKRCESYVRRIDWIDNRLRAGGYSSSQGNRWRAERRELSSKRAWECLRN
ncbi:DUF4124 domain-containing protein [Marinobacter nauticus]|uniref:DUF4124 domain-containing protein n=1 Tax=Marinobacter nauticus TaxID=2743 RepID=UPI004043AB37